MVDITGPYNLADVQAIKHSGFTSAGSFSGLGGSSLGFKMAGFETRYACEFEPHAAASYRSWSPKTHLDSRSISDVTGSDILDFYDGNLDVWEGSPPCSKFSTAGKRDKGWNQKSSSDSTKFKVQNVEDLFFEWVRILGEIKPKIAVAENVTAFLKGAAKGKAKQVISAVRGLGYCCEIWQLNASSFGVPQTRRRVFVVAYDHKRCAKPIPPKPLLSKPVSSRTAFTGISGVTALPPTDIPKSEWSLFVAPDMRKYAVGALLRELEVGQWHHKRFGLGIAHPDRPWPTLLSLELMSPGRSGSFHWDKHQETGHSFRKLCVAELQRIASLPDDFPWPTNGSMFDIGARIGNCVPPLLAAAVATSLREALEK